MQQAASFRPGACPRRTSARGNRHDTHGAASPGGRVFQNVDSPHRGTSPGSSAPWSSLLALVGFVGLCLLVGAAGGAITSGGLQGWYLSLSRPPGTPPAWVFGPVWTGLYVTIGVAGWLVWRRAGAAASLRLWGWQLLLNALWAPAFFGLRSTLAGLVVLVPLLGLVLLTVRAFARIDGRAAALLLPYAAWTGFAAYLNAGFCWLNRGS